MRILIQFPTRWRTEKFLKVLEKYFSMLSGRHDVRVQVISDTDDPKMARHEVEQAVKSITDGKYWFRRGSHRTKIEAVNSHMASSIGGWTWDACILASDDMIPQVNGYDNIVASYMSRYFPDTDGVLWFNDGYAGEKLNTLSIFGRKYYERWGYIYYPATASFFSDNDWQERAEKLGRQLYVGAVIIKHEHPCNLRKAPLDDLYKKNSASWDKDKTAFEAHRNRRFDIPLLDVLICTVPRRSEWLAKLTAELKRQMVQCNACTNVRIIVEGGQASIGEKRNRLLARARSEYVCFLDDDDNVGSTYIRRILDAIGCCDVDCIGIIGKIVDRGYNWRTFVHSVEYKTYSQMGEGTYIRPPNHLNPIRRVIAQRYEFENVNYGEDTRWAMLICNDRTLKSQRIVDAPIYYYIPSSVTAVVGLTAWDDKVLNQIRKDHQPINPTAQIRPVAPATEEPASRIGAPVRISATALENIPGLFPTVYHAAGHHRWEGPAWLKRKMELQARMRGPKSSR